MVDLNYKVVLISFLLMFIILGTVSANELNSTDPITEDNIKEIYVSDTGDDSNIGSSINPYATIGKAISDVNGSEDATIYISKGTFCSDDDVDFDINLNHIVNGGNLKFIGAGTNETFIDGQSSFRFARLGENTNITFKNITFINFKAEEGGTLYSEGILTVDNCVFKDSYVTKSQGGAILANGEEGSSELYVSNCEFIHCSVNGNPDYYSYGDGGGAIFAQNINYLLLVNNTFSNNRITNGLKGVSVYSSHYNADIRNNKFINLSGDNTDGALFIRIIGSDTQNVINNSFINCSNPSTKYSIVYLEGKTNFEGNAFINSSNSLGNVWGAILNTLRFEVECDEFFIGNNEINNGLPFVVKVSDDMGNRVCHPFYKFINFVSEDKSYSYSLKFLENSMDSYVAFDVIPENGIYNVSIRYNDNDSPVLGTCIVNISSEPIDLWVSPIGFDSNNGTYDNPFATIQHAIDVGFDKSFNVIVHLLNGIYFGQDNVELDVSNKGTLEIIGESINETIVDGRNQNWFLNANSNTFVKNIKFINGYASGNLFSGGIRSGLMAFQGSKLYLDTCIIDNNVAKNVLNNVNFNNLTYTNNSGSIYFDSLWIWGDAWNITNSYFANNRNLERGIINTQGSLNLSNNVFVNNSASEEGGVLFANNIISKYNYYAENYASFGGVVALLQTEGYCSFEGDVFIKNSASNYGVLGYKIPLYSSSVDLPIYFNNCSFIENYADDGSVIGFNEGHFVNCRFINNSALNHGAVSLSQGSFRDCLFLNNSASYGGAIFIKTLKKNENVNEITFSNVTFKDNFAKINGHDLYFEKLIENSLNYKFNDCINLTVYFNSKNVFLLADNLSASVIGPCGAIVGGNEVTFKLDDIKIGVTEVINGVAFIKYSGFENGEYNLSGDVTGMHKSGLINDGIVKVNLTGILSHREVWVSDLDGSDEIGDGGINSPYKTISYALNQATLNSRDIIVHIASGIYAGELNTMLDLSSMNNITLMGCGLDSTFIDGDNQHFLAKIADGPNKVVFANLTVKNMFNNQSAAIIVNEGANLYLSNISLINCDGFDVNGISATILNDGNLYCDEVIFNDNGNVSQILIYGKGFVKISNVYKFNNFKGSVFADTLIVNNSKLNGFSTSATNFISENTCFNNSFSSGSSNVYMNNVSIILNEVLSDNSIFGYAFSHQMRNVTVYNSLFYNFDKVWSLNTYENVFFSFDGCVFKNFTQLGLSHTIGERSIFTLSNCVFLNDGLVVDRTDYLHRPNPDIKLINCFWSNNSQPIVNFINNGDVYLTSNANEWIILTLENNVPKLQVTDGENVFEYNGNLPLNVGYTLIDGVMIPVIEVDGIVYPILDSIDISNPIEDPVLKPAVDSTIITNDLTVTYGESTNFTAKFLYPWGDPLANANVTFTIEGRNYTALTDASGIANIEIAFDAGAYTVITLNQASGQTNINSIVVNKLQSVVSATNVNTVYNGGKYLVITLKDSNGIALAGRDITVVLNSKAIKGKTDKNGQLKISTDTLAPKTYAATISFAGGANHLSSKAAATVKVGKATPKMTVKKATLKAKTKTKKYSITLKDNRNKAMKKVKVTLKVKGKTYKAATNSKGKATFKITKLTKKGSYKATVKFAGNANFKPVTKTVKITVKK